MKSSARREGKATLPSCIHQAGFLFSPVIMDLMDYRYSAAIAVSGADPGLRR
jgi:hypothetical protein